MRNKTIIVSAFSLLFLVFIAFDSMTSGSGAASGNTGAPGEQTCASCHSGAPLNQGKYISNLELFGDLDQGGYLPDSTYNITVRYKQKNKTRIGFQTTVLDNTNSPIGTLTVTSGKTRKGTASISGKLREYITHSSSGTSVTGDSILWTFQWKAPSSNVGDVSFYVILNVTNNNSGTSGDSLYTKKFTISTSGLLPDATASADTNSYCAQEKIQLKGSGTGSPTSYSWTMANGTPSSSTSQNPTVSYNIPGTHYAVLRVKNQYGWSDPDSFKLTINQLPTAFIQGTFPVTICPDDSVKIQAAQRTGYKYLWSNGDTTTFTYAKKAGFYSITTTNPEGCSRTSQTVEVKEYTRPTTTISSNALNDSACSGSAITFSGTASSDSIFLYKNFKMIARAGGDQITSVMDETADFNVRVKDGNGCMSEFSDTLRITVEKKLSGPEVMCKDKTTSTLLFNWQDTTAGHISGFQVSIDSGKNWISPNVSVSEHSLTGLKPDKDYALWVRGLTKFPCFYGSVGKQVCRTGPCNSIDATVSHDTLVCDGDAVEVTVHGLTGKQFSLSLEKGPWFSDSVFTFEPAITKTFILELIDSSNLGCIPEELEIPVRVENMAPVELRTIDGSNMYCENDTITFIASKGLEEYKFFLNNTLELTTQDSFYYQAAFENLDSAFVVAKRGVCVDTSATFQLIIIPTPDAGFTYSRAWKSYSFVPDVSFYSEYLWHFGDGDSSVIMMPSHDYGTSSGQVVKAMLKVTDSEGCVGYSEQEITLPDFTSVSEVSMDGIKLYPNPASDKLFIEFSNGIKQGTTVELIDMDGKVIISSELQSENSVIDLKGLPSGIYLVKVNDGEKTSFGRIMID